MSLQSLNQFNQHPNTNRYLAHVLSSFPESPQITEATLNNLSNWSTVSEKYSLKICRSTGVYAVDAARRMYMDKHLFIQALNYFGNLSWYNENIVLLSGWGVVQVIADHIDSKAFEEDVKLIAVKVLLNFSVASETIEAETGEEDATISMSIFTSGGAHAILALMQQFSENAGLVLNAVECLNNICLERPGGVAMPGVSIVESLLPAGLLDTVVNLLRVYDYDEVIMEPTVELLASIVSSDKAQTNLVRSGVITSLVSIVETHASNEHILVNATIAFNILAADVSLRKTLSDAGAMDTVRNVRARSARTSLL